MQPSNFNESNTILDTPPGIDPQLVQPLPVYRGQYVQSGSPCTIFCVKLTQAEIDEIQRTGRVWVSVLSHLLPPIHLSSTNPFARPRT